MAVETDANDDDDDLYEEDVVVVVCAVAVVCVVDEAKETPILEEDEGDDAEVIVIDLKGPDFAPEPAEPCWSAWRDEVEVVLEGGAEDEDGDCDAETVPVPIPVVDDVAVDAIDVVAPVPEDDPVPGALKRLLSLLFLLSLSFSFSFVASFLLVNSASKIIELRALTSLCRMVVSVVTNDEKSNVCASSTSCVTSSWLNMFHINRQTPYGRVSYLLPSFVGKDAKNLMNDS